MSHEPVRISGPSAAAVARVDCADDTRALAANDNVIDPPKGGHHWWVAGGAAAVFLGY